MWSKMMNTLSDSDKIPFSSAVLDVVSLCGARRLGRFGVAFGPNGPGNCRSAPANTPRIRSRLAFASHSLLQNYVPKFDFTYLVGYRIFTH